MESNKEIQFDSIFKNQDTNNLEVTVKKLNHLTKDFDFDNLQIVIEIGEGTQASVFLAKDIELGHKYAIKEYSNLSLKKECQINDIEREISILKTMNHPFICRFIDVQRSELLIKLAFEFCQGGDLFYHLKKLRCTKNKRFSEDAVKFYIACIVLALEEIHSKGIIFRDLKPENILIDNYGYPRI